MAKNYEEISIAQSNKEQSINEAFLNANPAMQFGIRRSLTAGLSFSLFGAKLSNDLIFNETTLSLAASSTNYIEADITTKTVVFNQTKFTYLENPARIPLWKVTTDASSIIETSVIDERSNPLYSPASSIPEATETALGLVKRSKTITKNSDGQIDVLVDGTTIVRDSATGTLSAPGGGSGGGGSGLTYLEEEKNTTLNALLLKVKASVSEAIIGIGHIAKGISSSFIVSYDTMIGNVRGSNAIDVQLLRDAATQVASGPRSLCIGSYNTASNNDAVCIGARNTASYGVAIGNGNTNSNTYTMNFGRDNTASATYGFCLGYNNTSSGANSTTIGFANSATARYAVASGCRNLADAEYSTVTGNDASSKGIKYSFNRGNAFTAATKGSVQESLHLLYRTFTTADTETFLTSDGTAQNATNQITLLNNETKTFEATIKMQSASSPTAIAVWKVEGTVARYANAASTVFAFPVEFTKTQLNAQATAEAFNLTVSIDTTLGCLKFTCSKNTTTAVKVVAAVKTIDLY